MTLRSGDKRSRAHHSVRFQGDDMPKYKSLDTECNTMAAGEDGGPASPDTCSYTPAVQRHRLNEQRIKLLTSINQVVLARAELESNRSSLTSVLDDLRRKLRRRIDDCHAEKKERCKALKAANLRLEREKYSIMSEMEHLKRHLEREESHHLQHARTAVAQAIHGVVTRAMPPDFNGCSMADLPSVVSRSVARNAPSRMADNKLAAEQSVKVLMPMFLVVSQADNKLAAARLMRDIAELRQRVAQVEIRLANELKRKRQAELDIVRLRKELSATKSCVASLRMPACPLRSKCSKFA